MKLYQTLPLLAVLALGVAGCQSGGSNSGPIPADTQAKNDPNGKATALLNELAALPVDERQGWAQRRSTDFVVFQSVTDPQLRARYDAEIAPLLAGQ